MTFRSGSEVADVAVAGSDSGQDPAPDDVGGGSSPPQILQKMWKDMNPGADGLSSLRRSVHSYPSCCCH